MNEKRIFENSLKPEDLIVQVNHLFASSPVCLEAGDIMSRNVATISSHTKLFAAAKLMSKNNITRLPVVDRKNELMGIITRSDIVHQIAKLKRP